MTRAPLDTPISNKRERDAGAWLLSMAEMETENDECVDLATWEVRAPEGSRATGCDVARARRAPAIVASSDPSLSGRFPGLAGVEFVRDAGGAQSEVPSLSRRKAY